MPLLFFILLFSYISPLLPRPRPVREEGDRTVILLKTLAEMIEWI
jgi:hypothetical protein